ncbi:1,4-dihydroxy-2-naphthoate prenyltransferase [Streptomyces sp. 3MP-14]|uniref:1,4-dihydroxy-2-naphthoate prenyltransferase n=1 Tax=Streptomyces mimosae TaxID=2586635 RepID=A0A5N6A0S9_9ACTN|nr:MULTISPECIES: UbiA family prenyltransferase [Streptomyces]KAB8161270.1 1,4-dihydroxy-2-naphthoate prenyltransferase [Streptomyces mimosae]KAB8173072.1 1,4-dihydroxy-2-naphthoate prenyltransferase [Streptomyces sp. 3MP-14]
MTQDLTDAPDRAGDQPPGRPTARPAESRARAFARLGKLDVYDYYPSIAVAASAVLLPLADFEARTALVLGLFLVGEVFVVMAMVALDDITGYHDGSDAANYGPNHPLRNVLRKPLVAGTLTLREAHLFAWGCAALGTALWAATVALAPHRPGWALLVTAALLVVSLQYSYGLKISYHGFQEVFLCGLGVGLVVAPHALVTGGFSGFLLVQGVLFGCGPLLFGVYSNTNDIEGDRAVGRRTVAALVSPRGNARFVGALSVGEFAVGAGASLAGVAPWWFVLAMLPVTALRARQFHTGFVAGDIMRARRIGFTAHRVAIMLLIGVNLALGAGVVA